MAVSPVRPELGPSLPQLVGARRARLALTAAAVVAVLAVVLPRLADGPGGGAGRVVVAAPVAFNLDAGELQRAPARGEEALRLVSAPGDVRQELRATPLRLEPYAGDPVAALMSVAQLRADRLRRELGASLVVRGEGRTRVNEQPGYQLQYQFRLDGRTAYGRLVLLVPAEKDVLRPREAVALDLRTQRSPAVPSVFAVGDNGALKTPLRSFRFGTETP